MNKLILELNQVQDILRQLREKLTTKGQRYFLDNAQNHLYLLEMKIKDLSNQQEQTQQKYDEISEELMTLKRYLDQHGWDIDDAT